MGWPIDVLPTKESMKKLTDNWKELVKQARDTSKLAHKLANTINNATVNEDYKPKNFMEFYKGIDRLQKMLDDLLGLICNREKIRKEIYGKPEFDEKDAEIFRSLGKPFSHLFYDAAANFSKHSGEIFAARMKLIEIIRAPRPDYNLLLNQRMPFEKVFKLKLQLGSDMSTVSNTISWFLRSLEGR